MRTAFKVHWMTKQKNKKPTRIYNHIEIGWWQHHATGILFLRRYMKLYRAEGKKD